MVGDEDGDSLYLLSDISASGLWLLNCVKLLFFSLSSN